MAKSSLLNPLKVARFLLSKPKTTCYPFTLKEPALRYRGFHLNDWDACTGCGNCADICPNDAIEMIEIAELESVPGMKNERPRLDYGRCCFCGLCVDICPPGSLRLSRDYFHIHFDTGTFVFTPKDDKTDEETFVPDESYSVLKASLSLRKRNYDGFSSDLDFALFEPERIPMPELPPSERKLSFVEQVIGYDREEAVHEASRCLGCGLCEDACPAHMKISDYIAAIYEDAPDESLRKIYEDNPIPAICGRLCMKHCEDACALRLRGEPVAIRWLKRFASDSIRDY
jgi:glutamate synthase (NADPH/NADH) small chain